MLESVIKVFVKKKILLEIISEIINLLIFSHFLNIIYFSIRSRLE